MSRPLVRASVATFAVGVLLGVPSAGSAAAPGDKPAKQEKAGGSAGTVEPLGRKAG